MAKSSGAIAPQQSLARKVYENLVERILSGELPPGSLIKRREVARELRASVAPVLEAMVRLETEGFLETHPRKGTQVRVASREDVRGSLVVRAALECEAASWYAGAPLREMRQTLEKLAGAADRPGMGPVERWRADLAFHRALVDCAGVAALGAAFTRSSTLWWFYAIHSSLGEQDMPRESHEGLLESLLRAKDGASAARLIRAHIRTGKGGLLS